MGKAIQWAYHTAEDASLGDQATTPELQERERRV